MHILSIVVALVITSGNAILAYVAMKQAERAADHALHAQRLYLQLKEDRPRVTVLERDTEALRRELRKLGGKFYAAQREQEVEIADVVVDPNVPPVCENYAVAQREGPNSKQAKCDCDYCTRRRKEKREFRDRQAQAGHLDPRWIAAHTAGTGNHGE